MHNTFNATFLHRSGHETSSLLTSEDGVMSAPEGSIITEDGSLVAADGTILAPPGSVVAAEEPVHHHQHHHQVSAWPRRNWSSWRQTWVRLFHLTRNMNWMWIKFWV